MGISLDGLVSGLNTAELIKSLMAVEAIPQNILQNKYTSTQNYLKALQSLNTSVAALAELGKKGMKPDALELYTAKSSHESATVTVGTGAGATQLDVTVEKLATAQQLVTAPMTAWPSDPPVLTIKAADGSLKEITADSSSFEDIVSAINAADAGVQATRIAAGVDAGTGETTYRLQLTAKESGAAGGFTIFNGSGAVPGSELAATTIRSGEDASVTLWKGTPAEQVVTSSSNTFTDLMPGVSLSVTAISTAPITITVARDDAAIGKVAESLIDKLNEALEFIGSKRTLTTTTGSDGKPVVTGGVFSSDSTVRDVEQRLLNAASAPIDGRSPSEFGISITKGGRMEFDAEKFAKSMAADPGATQRALTVITTRLEEAARISSDKYDGQLTNKITGQTSLSKDITEQIANWDRRLELREATLKRTYSALEVQLSKLNAQSSWIGSQLAGLNSGNSQ
ncbi:flagellar filament capping protein FliD [Microterricola viridarii]|uniref:Flagellar hook-associated protein 2 n=1 Tax=Microterricola viridarii TaxID=412690 RepID=A0A1H1W5P8_9MICO|nr:flagellar filament capping protein FliD [Microterricola viridarii]SDS92413.1 flagellar hook-associated protein 2 [Microterricola viridarii]